MKRAKIMLSAIALFAVVGGALAFKAKNLESIVFTHDPADPVITRCTVPLEGITTTTNPNPIVLSATTTTTLPCVVKTFYTTL